MTSIHQYQDLIALFNQTFSDSERTILVRGEDEPIYIPAKTIQQKHQIVFAHGYFASALHEIAHWCIAGKERRLLEDYGYWYCPDGRNQEQQAQFEKVEVKPQAVEWALSCATDKPFRVSTDNLNGAPVDVRAFQQAVQTQAQTYLRAGFPKRAAIFIQVLQNFYHTSPLNSGNFTWANEDEILTHV
ncbi:elongation factor P hydroxylase [Paraglaciecola aquimarina]|uniref:Elongation factor P hydroxylase n=1 Tax=Paraglaciecola algarum TaxID=3050085 RepID=A0ABS9D6S7_9ALTE|nr:elongation factor P hydroxylase [Paraglaciecola sp. G1-23]MCF2948576.1 elongation factor P hydroxylase [Paraglaciecola sp. G1-23]